MHAPFGNPICAKIDLTQISDLKRMRRSLMLCCVAADTIPGLNASYALVSEQLHDMPEGLIQTTFTGD